MTLIKQLPNPFPFIIGEGLAVKQLGAAKGLDLPDAESLNDICYCDWECEYKGLVFGHPDGKGYKNDASDFLFKKFLVTDTVVITLEKSGTVIATITDDTYGLYYPSFTNDPLTVGFLLQFQKVLAIEGTGVYQLKAILTIAGTDFNFSSQKYRLLSYDDILANKTVRIESFQTGNIIRSVFDYSLLVEDLPNGWYQSVRIPGFFGDKTPSLEVDNYIDQEYEKQQIQTKVVNTWTLETGLIPNVLVERITQDNVLANKILITDYNFLNVTIYRQINLSSSEMSDFEFFRNNRLSKFIVKFTDKLDNLFKSNF